VGEKGIVGGGNSISNGYRGFNELMKWK